MDACTHARTDGWMQILFGAHHAGMEALGTSASTSCYASLHGPAGETPWLLPLGLVPLSCAEIITLSIQCKSQSPDCLLLDRSYLWVKMREKRKGVRGELCMNDVCTMDSYSLLCVGTTYLQKKKTCLFIYGFDRVHLLKQGAGLSWFPKWCVLHSFN